MFTLSIDGPAGTGGRRKNTIPAVRITTPADPHRARDCTRWRRRPTSDERLLPYNRTCLAARPVAYRH